MDKLLKLGRSFYKSYSKLKLEKKDINSLSESDIYKEILSEMNSLDIDKQFKFEDSIHFPLKSKLNHSLIHKEDGICIGIFYVAKSCQMPLHDHPNMFVFTRPLKGKALKKMYSIKDEIDRQKQLIYPLNYWYNDNFDKSKEVTLKGFLSMERNIEKGDSSLVIEPRANNLHEIFAYENYAFLDLIIPDYDMYNQNPYELRFCNFYKSLRVLDAQKQLHELKISSFPADYDVDDVPSPLIGTFNPNSQQT